jgi:hypothetical protein
MAKNGGAKKTNHGATRDHEGIKRHDLEKKGPVISRFSVAINILWPAESHSKKTATTALFLSNA